MIFSFFKKPKQEVDEKLTIKKVVLGATERDFTALDNMVEADYRRFQQDCEAIGNSKSFEMATNTLIREYLNIIHLHAENEEQAQFARDAINVILKLEEKIRSFAPSAPPEEMSDEDKYSII